MSPRRAVAIADVVAASGWCDQLAANGIGVSVDDQAEAEAATLRASGIDVFLAVDTRDPAVKAWAAALDAATARAKAVMAAGETVREAT